ncbi:MAG TPA: hypothetical protein PKI89_08030, partial [Tepidiformaceae bacterium]|nr:hypothetical protein [Tepidiformaceae bacterium]
GKDAAAPEATESPAGPGPTVVRAERSGEPRTVRLGFSSLPPERTSESYIQAFATAAQYADAILVQRTPPWEDFMPGGEVSKQTADSTRLETALLKQYGLELVYAIDPTDGVVQRSRLANLPPSVDPQAGFKDPNVREAFVAYAAYIAKNYQPAYMALGVEVNMTYERAPEQFEAYLQAYSEAYDVVKGNSPNTKVFPTFQLEDLEGAFGDVHAPRWNLLERFHGRMDVLAISTYPFLGEAKSAADIRPDYYSQLKDHWPGEIIISETGYASAPVEGRVTVGTEADQQAYLTRLLDESNRLGFSLVIWFAALDPSFASTGATSVFKDIGLRKSDGSNKLAWATWEAWAARPLANP